MRNRKISLLMSFILVITSACSALAAPAHPNRRADCQPARRRRPLFRFISKSQSPLRDLKRGSGKSPDYKITAQIPN